MNRTSSGQWPADRLVDSHAHLTASLYAGKLAEVLDRADRAGVGVVIDVGTDVATSRAAIDHARSYPLVRAAAGVHPGDLPVAGPDWPGEIRKLLAEPEVVALGEIGLDYHYDTVPREAQRDAFRRQLDLALTAGLPALIHCREAMDDVLKTMEESGIDRGIMHCFSGGCEEARRAIDLGFLISFAGNLTFKKSRLPELARSLPTGRLVLETDSPYLTPVPYRGKPNEPSRIVHTARELARVLSPLTYDDIVRLTGRNAARVLGLGGGKWEQTIAYKIGRSLYLNLTNRCDNECVFCARGGDCTVKGYDLRLELEPTPDEVLAAVEASGDFDEVVFCGYGEPTLRLDLVTAVGSRLRGRGIPVRLNTNGLGSLHHGRDIVPELAGSIDSISVSLNASDASEYDRLCRSRFGPRAFPAVLDFIRRAGETVGRVQATAVAYPGVDTGRVERLATGELGVEFRLRRYQPPGKTGESDTARSSGAGTAG